MATGVKLTPTTSLNSTGRARGNDQSVRSANPCNQSLMTGAFCTVCGASTREVDVLTRLIESLSDKRLRSLKLLKVRIDC